jgi:hypothetical protein
MRTRRARVPADDSSGLASARAVPVELLTEGRVELR